MIPIIYAINDWQKSKKKNMVKNLNTEYNKANNYFFGK
jgi:hypothetical protein